MSTETNERREAAFALLLSVLDDFVRGGRRTFSAGVKPEMQRRSNGGFSETTLGYASFRSFLEDAEQRGLVTLSPTATGPDIQVNRTAHTPTAPPVMAAATKASGLPRTRIRPDFWKAFVDWRSDWKRYFDAQVGVAVMFPATPHPVGELPEFADLRQSVERHSDRFIEIPLVPQSEQIEWMKEFAGAQTDPEFAEQLRVALATPRPSAAFTILLRSRSAALSKWNKVRETRVQNVIAEWAAGLPLPVTYLEDVQPTTAPSSGIAGILSGDERSLRDAVHHAVDSMPIAELLRLSIPLEYMVRR